MLKQTITFKDLDGEDVTEDFYFNLSTVELAEMELGTNSMSDKIQKIIAGGDTGKIFETFKEILSKAIGQRSEDGRRFIKNQEVVDNFFQSNAYEVLFLEWISDGNKAAEFINALMPADLDSTVAKVAAQQKANESKTTVVEQPAWIREDRDPTEAELRSMTPDQMRAAFIRKNERLNNGSTS